MDNQTQLDVVLGLKAV